MKYETPRILTENHIELQQLVAGCSMTENENRICDTNPNTSTGGS